MTEATTPIDIPIESLLLRRISDKMNPHGPDGSCKAILDFEERLTMGSERMDRIEKKIDANNSDTSEILDILHLGKSFFRILGYIGAALKWAAAIGAPVVMFWYSIKSGGKP